MGILEKIKWTLLEKHPYNLSVMDEHSNDEWVVIVSYPDVFIVNYDTYSYLCCNPEWLLEKLEEAKDDNEIDNWIWKLNWRKTIDEVKLELGEK